MSVISSQRDHIVASESATYHSVPTGSWVCMKVQSSLIKKGVHKLLSHVHRCGSLTYFCLSPVWPLTLILSTQLPLTGSFLILGQLSVNPWDGCVCLDQQSVKLKALKPFKSPLSPILKLIWTSASLRARITLSCYHVMIRYLCVFDLIGRSVSWWRMPSDKS